jgi:hypothetical protein
MFDLANAMKKNYNSAIRDNPVFMIDMFLKVLDEDDNIIARIPVSVISKGSFTLATRDEDNNVYLLIDEDDSCGEMTKSFLAFLNRQDGEQPYVPVVEEIGWYKKPRTENKYLRVYKSPLYKSPFRKSDSPEGWEMYKVLKKVIDESKEYTYNKNRSIWGVDSRYRTISALEALDEEPPKGVDEDTWKAFIETVTHMIRESMNWGTEWIMEISPRNLATDGNGQLILLDIFFDGRALENQRSNRC